MESLALVIFYLLLLCAICSASCHNGCNLHGNCSAWSTCECFTGWEGPDCAFRVCPSGPAFADIPSDIDTAHQLKVCSSQGSCNRSTGVCECRYGFAGYNCGVQIGCTNDCSGHGRCLTLGQMATENDGYRLNYTTSYTLWDADIIKGCVCDPGNLFIRVHHPYT